MICKHLHFFHLHRSGPKWSSPDEEFGQARRLRLPWHGAIQFRLEIRLWIKALEVSSRRFAPPQSLYYFHPWRDNGEEILTQKFFTGPNLIISAFQGFNIL